MSKFLKAQIETLKASRDFFAEEFLKAAKERDDLRLELCKKNDPGVMRYYADLIEESARMAANNVAEKVGTKPTAANYCTEQRRDVYRQAIARYGTMSQIMVAIEEMSELTKELCKLNRDQTTNEKLASEMADVAIMLEQLRLIFDIDELVAEETYRKIQRLENNLTKGAN